MGEPVIDHFPRFSVAVGVLLVCFYEFLFSWCRFGWRGWRGWANLLVSNMRHVRATFGSGAYWRRCVTCIYAMRAMGANTHRLGFSVRFGL